MLRNYLKIAWRNLIKNKVYTLINILGLGIGITACVVIYFLASYELSFDKFHPDSNRIYRVVGSQTVNGTQYDYGYVPAPLPLVLQHQVRGLEKVAAFYNYYAKIAIPVQGKDPVVFEMPKSEDVSPVIITQPEYFSIFKYTWLTGNAATALSEPHKVVLSDREAYRFFGKIPVDQMLGKEVIYNDSLPLTVAGVVRSWDGNTDLNFSNFISFATVEHSFLKNEIGLKNWRSWDSYSQAFVKLGSNVQPEQVNAQLTAFIKDHFGKDAKDIRLKLQPLNDIHYNAVYTDGFSRKAHLPTLYVLIGIAVFILLIAAVNYINLSTAQSVLRFKETGIRKVLGSSRTRLMLQFLSETAIITLVAVLIAAALVKPAFLLFESYLPQGIVIDPFSFSTGLFFLGIFLVTSLLAGIYPARVLSAGQPINSLKGKSGQDVSLKSYFLQGLIIFQFTISLIFIIGTIGVGRQTHYLLSKDLGFNKDAIINIKIPGGSKAFDTKDVLAQKVKQLPSVAKISLHRQTPVSERHANTTIKNLSSGAQDINASFEYCDENFVDLYGIKILEGRNILPSDTIKEFLINAVCAKELGFKDPADAIGKRVATGIGGKSGPVVGVVGDFHAQSLHETIKPFFITANAKGQRTLSVKLSMAGKGSADFNSVIAAIEQIWHQLNPDEKFEYSFFDQTIASYYEAEQKVSRLVNIAMGIAIFISCMGLYGVTAFITRQRTKEIGIRKVLGASTEGIIMLLFKEFLKPVFLAIVIASPIAWFFMHRWLQDFPFRVSITWEMFAVAGLCAVVIAVSTVSTQAVAAARTNPAKSLKTE